MFAKIMYVLKGLVEYVYFLGKEFCHVNTQCPRVEKKRSLNKKGLLNSLIQNNINILGCMCLSVCWLKKQYCMVIQKTGNYKFTMVIFKKNSLF